MRWWCSLGLLLGLACASRAPVPPGFEAAGAGRLRHEAAGIVLVRIEPGRFQMGSPDSEHRRDGDEVLHEAHVEAAFYLGETEVTVEQWRRVMGDDAPEAEGPGDMPVGDVSWYRADEFARRLARTTPGFRLPSETEWEYACRAGTTTPFAFGEDVTPTQAHTDAGAPYHRDAPRGVRPRAPLPVRSLPPNAWGLYEMHGNVWEWVEDAYVWDPSTGEAPQGSPGGPRVLRGGGFDRGAHAARCAYRDGYPPSTATTKYGLRIAWSP